MTHHIHMSRRQATRKLQRDTRDGRDSFRTLASTAIPLCCWQVPKFICAYGDLHCRAAVDGSVQVCRLHIPLSFLLIQKL